MQPAAIEQGFAEAVAERTLLVLDAGTLASSPPSTLVDCTGNAPRLVREGAIAPGRLKAIVPALVV
jgi:tRNA A37 threonylcarbamoyladenosine synthetase subunit TsaC/SUA5/YrdC